MSGFQVPAKAIERMDSALSDFIFEAVPSGWSAQAQSSFQDTREELSMAWLELQQAITAGVASPSTKETDV